MTYDDDEDDEETMDVMACNWPVLDAFLSCSTQWRTAVVVMGGGAAIASRIVWLGLDYTAVDVVLRARGLRAGVLEDIMAMETAALPILNEGD